METTETVKVAIGMIIDEEKINGLLKQRNKNKKSGIYSAFFMFSRLSNPIVIFARLYTELSGTRKVA